MAGRDDLLAELPAPHPEEPVSLRRDIADELRDHLECAVRRESLQNANLDVVKARVLDRFGNPQKIARKLWLDAMKEILMMQKLTLALVSLVAVASLAACGLMWSLARDFQSVASDAQAASAKLLAQGQETNAELLKQNQQMMQQLTALANRPAEPAPLMDWNPLKVRVVKNDEANSPAQGFQVSLNGPHVSESANVGVDKTTDENGVADFGMVRPGHFQGTVSTPWGEGRQFAIQVSPGRTAEKEIIAPTAPLQPIQVKPVVQWPKQLEGLDVAVLVKVFRRDSTKIGDEEWYGGGKVDLLIRPDGRFAVYENIYHLSDSVRFQGSSDEDIYDRMPIPNSGEEFPEFFSWNGREPMIEALSIVHLPKEADFPKQGDQLKWLAPASFLERYANQYPIVQIQQADVAQALKSETLGEGQQWTFEIPLPYIFVAKTMLAPEQFANLPDQAVVMAAMVFLLADQDFSNELSEEELKSASSFRASRLTFEESPVSFKTFIEAYALSYAESQKSRESRGRSGPAG